MNRQIKRVILHLSDDKLAELLNMFTPEVLCVPIAKNPGKFQHLLNGFRLNKIHMDKLLNLYNTDRSMSNCILTEYLVDKIEEKFAINGVIEAIKLCDKSILKGYFALKNIISSENLKIGVATIFELYEIEFDEETINVLDQNVNELVSCTEEKIKEIDKTEIGQLNDKLDRAKKNLLKEKERKEEISEELGSKKRELKAIENKYKSLDSKHQDIVSEIKKFEVEIENSKKKLAREVTAKNEINKKLNEALTIKKNLEMEIKNLNATLADTNLVVATLEQEKFTPESIAKVSDCVISNLSKYKTDNGIIEQFFKENFTEGDSFSEGISHIEKEKNELIDILYEKMLNNDIHEDDLKEIKRIENLIRIEFVICNSLYATCMEYVAQEIRGTDIIETF